MSETNRMNKYDCVGDYAVERQTTLEVINPLVTT